MTAILFGSIGTLADTSELQREAFNAAFAEHGLDWQWSQEEYRELLASSGGAERIATYAEGRGEQVDAAAVHATKSELFQRYLRERGAQARPGVVETIAAAHDRGARLALVTTTSAENIAALKSALAPSVDLDGFDLVLDTTAVEQAKPAPDIYALALQRLDAEPSSVVAIEDNAGGVSAAASAGLRVIAFPGENNAAHDLSAATRRMDALDPAEVSALAQGHDA